MSLLERYRVKYDPIVGMVIGKGWTVYDTAIDDGEYTYDSIQCYCTCDITAAKIAGSLNFHDHPRDYGYVLVVDDTSWHT